MAASLVRLLNGRLLSKVSECMFCDNVLNHTWRNVAHQKTNLASKYSSSKLYSSRVKAVEVSEEPDALYRQVTVEVKGHDRAVIDSYTKFVSLAASELDINLANVSEPTKDIRRYTVLKSVHIYSKHMVQYEARTHYRVYQLRHLTGSTADTFLEYIQRNLPEGVAMKVTKDRLERLPDHLVPPVKLDKAVQNADQQ